MPRFEVELTGWAMMRQTQYVLADNEEDAIELARENTGEFLWEYEGVDDDTVEVNVYTENQKWLAMSEASKDLAYKEY